MMLALSGFIIPFSFVYDPALLLIERQRAAHRGADAGGHAGHRHARHRL